jgi:diguanylate cyclase (GGDEF)-like protein
VQHLYYLPIVLAAARFGATGGVLAALAAIGLYHAANPQLLLFQYRELDLVEVVLFLAVGIITAKIARDARRLRTMAMTDDLTGLANLRAFELFLAGAVRAARTHHSSVALLVLDLDRLKAINDDYGHLAGAEGVRTVGRIIADNVPPEALACRYGGDEFVIALPDATATQAEEVAGSISRAVRASSPVLAGVAFARGTLSISIGVSRRRFGPSEPDEMSSDEEVGERLFHAADTALYRAKKTGRDRVCVA